LKEGKKKGLSLPPKIVVFFAKKGKKKSALGKGKKGVSFQKKKKGRRNQNS